MTAKEMFEKLGYKKDIFNKEIVWCEVEYGCETRITFDLEERSVYPVLDGEGLEIDMSLLKAIIQQCEELYWIDWRVEEDEKL